MPFVTILTNDGFLSGDVPWSRNMEMDGLKESIRMIMMNASEYFWMDSANERFLKWSIDC